MLGNGGSGNEKAAGEVARGEKTAQNCHFADAFV
jgi:hypothetical protein